MKETKPTLPDVNYVFKKKSSIVQQTPTRTGVVVVAVGMVRSSYVTMTSILTIIPISCKGVLTIIPISCKGVP